MHGLNFRVLVQWTLGAVAIRTPQRTALVPEQRTVAYTVAVYICYGTLAIRTSYWSLSA